MGGEVYQRSSGPAACFRTMEMRLQQGKRKSCPQGFRHLWKPGRRGSAVCRKMRGLWMSGFQPDMREVIGWP